MRTIVKMTTAKGATDYARLAGKLAEPRRIYFAVGCFDAFHPGHLRYLQAARDFAGETGVVMVAVNSDEYIQRSKGHGRPIVGIDDRLATVAELECVDIVFEMHDDEPSGLIREIRPYAVVRGYDQLQHASANEILAILDVGCVVCVAGRYGEWSTTGLVERIRRLR